MYDWEQSELEAREERSFIKEGSDECDWVYWTGIMEYLAEQKRENTPVFTGEE